MSMRDLDKVSITSETAESDFDREKFKVTLGRFDLAERDFFEF
jgi:hypothetical protein